MSCGRAPELLQRNHAAELLGIDPNLLPPPTPAAAAPPPPPLSASQQPAEAEQASVAGEEDKPVNPAVAALEILPDEDLTKLALSKNIKVDGRWGRDRLIAEILSANSAPPPPPTIQPTIPPPPPVI